MEQLALQVPQTGPQAAAVEVGGKGGGRPDMAQGSGADATGIGKALAAAEKVVKAGLGV